MRQSHLILSNAAIIWTTRILQLVPQLVLVPFLIRTIGEFGYGVYALVWSLMMSIDQLEKSLQSGVTKYSAAFLARKQIREVNKVISSSCVYSIFLAILACAGILAASALYDDPTGKMSSSLMVVGIMILFIIPMTPYVAVIQSRQRYYVGAIAETVSKYISLFAVMLWFGSVGASVEALIIIMAVTLFLSRLAQVPVAYRLVPGLRNDLHQFDWGSFRLIASFGTAIVLASLCIVANTTGIRWMMSSLVSTSFIAHLVIILMPGLLMSQIITAVTVTIMPATSAYEATGNGRMLKELLIQGMRYTTIIVLSGLIVAGLLMEDVLEVWVGPGYVFLAPYALALLAGVSFMLSTSSGHHMLKGMGKLRATVFIYFIGLAIIPFSLTLAVFQLWQDPYLAVTIGLTMGNIACGLLQIGFGMKAVHADFRGIFTRAYAQPAAVALLVSALVFGLTVYTGIDGLFGRAFMSLTAVLLFLGACYSLIATTAERRQFREFGGLVMNKISVILRIPSEQGK